MRTSRIDTYELAKEISEVLATEMNANTVKQKFASLAVTCLSSEEQRQALIQAIMDKCESEKVKELFTYADSLVDEYTWRNTTEEMKAKLKEYNCKEPFVVCSTTAEAIEAFNDGYPIYAIEKTGNYTVCQSEFDIRNAEKNGCIFGSNQHTMDDIFDKILSPGED